MGLFTPAWKNKDPQKRKEAVLKMTDQEKLKKVAAQDLEDYVRGYALERITDEKFLAAYAVQINDEWLRSKALEQIRSPELLVALAVHLTKNANACKVCFNALSGKLPKEALPVLYQAGGWAALYPAEQRNDEDALKRLLRDPEQQVTYRAKWALEKIEKNKKMMSDDPSVLRPLLLVSTDEDLVIKAAEKLRDDDLIMQRLMTECAKDYHQNKNYKLIEKLTKSISNPDRLKQLVESDNRSLQVPTADHALERLMSFDPGYVEAVARNQKIDRNIRCNAVMQLTDPALLTEIGLKDPEVRFYVMLNKHFNDDPRLITAILESSDSSENDVVSAVERCKDQKLLLKRLETEKSLKVIKKICTGIPDLKPYAGDIETVLKSGPVAGVNYERRKLTPTVVANFSRDAEKELAIWTGSANRLIDFAKTNPKSLLPLWDRLDKAITGSVAEIRYHRWLDTGRSEYDSNAQDFKFTFDEKHWTETHPTGLTFPPKPQ